jgi:hypothetical protein
VRSSLFSPPGCALAQDGKIRVRQHAKRDVPVPTRPGAHFVVVKPNLALGLLKAGLNRPARASYPHQLGKWRRLRRQGQIKGDLVRLGDLAPDQQALLPALGRAAISQVSPVVDPWSLGAIAGAEPEPASVGTSSSQSSTGLKPSRWAEVTAST